MAKEIAESLNDIRAIFREIPGGWNHEGKI